MLEKEKIYCSLDIETSGFDPLKDEILEVGFILFKISAFAGASADKEDFGFKVLEEYTQVFKSSQPVPAKILGLTGILQAELDQAPKFAEHREFIQDKLKDAVIVGHNVVFDLKFLAGLEIKPSGKIIDTLDLAQWLLPTHHSYNLENLMHYFGISHKDAHRALADAKASFEVLKKLLAIYQNFDLELKAEIKKIIAGKNFEWEPLLEVLEKPPLTKIFPLPIFRGPRAKGETGTLGEFAIQPNRIYNFPFGADFIGQILAILARGRKKTLLVLPKKQQVMELWQERDVFAAFESEDLFDAEKFKKFLAKENLSSDEIKFALKILVWQKTNWQKQCLLDLNLSFFGGQFKNLISGKELKEEQKAKIVCCDRQTFLQLSKSGLYKKRTAIIAGLSEFEAELCFGIGSKVSWGAVAYNLKFFYNPETGAGALKYKKIVSELLNGADLFFGLAGALLKSEKTGFVYVKITPEMVFSEKYKKLKTAAENFCQKLVQGNKILRSEKIAEICENLERIFLPEQNFVKWVELSEQTCAFCSAPVDIKHLAAEVLANFAGASFADILPGEKSLEYFVSRLGLKKFKITNIPAAPPEQAGGDLFSGFLAADKTSCYIGALSVEQIAEKLTAQSLPAAALFASLPAVREFYENYYQRLGQYAFILSQSGSGGSSKLMHNFAIHKNSLLLATDKMLLKFLANGSLRQPKQNLRVKTLILLHLPFEQFTHPYQEAVAELFENPFVQHSLPRALLNFHKLLQFFHHFGLKNLYLADPKLDKPYARVFIDYVRSLSWINFIHK